MCPVNFFELVPASQKSQFTSLGYEYDAIVGSRYLQALPDFTQQNVS